MRATDAIPPSPPARPLARALPGIVLLVGGWSCSLLPTPTELAAPHDVADPGATCAQVAQASPLLEQHVVLSGHFEETGEERRVRIVCDDGSDVVVRGNVHVTGAPGYIRVRWDPDDEAWWVAQTCMRCSGMPARHAVPVEHRAMWLMRILGMLAGVLGAWLFVAGWVRRPFDPVEDLAAARRVRAVTTFVAPSAEHVLVDGRQYREPRLGWNGGELGGQAGGKSQIVVGGASGSYRNGAHEVRVVGPAKLLGVAIREGETAPLLDGDEVALEGHAAVSITFPEAGVVARFFARDAASIEVLGRFPSANARLRSRGAVMLLGIGVVISLWDAPWAMAAGLPPLALGLALTFALPRQLTSKAVTRIDLEALAGLELVPAGGSTAMRLHGQILGHLPSRSSAIGRAAHVELERLVAHARRASAEGAQPTMRSST